ncbi:His-Xaa-Ser repeat protein HxsA [Pacificispira sp.]|uniref:His-Xaa-Ser repeat protein HxsA n=1 Tax=Pacificispira sp. TaxID=2888761 RepID=UPI003B52A15F
MRRRFAIPSLLAAGFVVPEAAAGVPIGSPQLDPIDDPSVNHLEVLQKYHLAGHRSHKSHKSHSSHRSSSGGSYSGSTGSTGSYTPPATGNSTPPSSVLPQSPATTTLPGHSEKFRQIVMRVQAALFSRGYYNGSIDGLVGPQTRAAVSKFQRDNGQTITGTLTPELLNALQVAAN